MEDRIKKFVTLIDAGTYTAAARQLHTSQPALTTAIQKLEREIKSPLLVRGSRALQMTREGGVVYKHGQQLLREEQNLQAELGALAGEKQPFVLGCIDSIALTIVQAKLLPILEADSEVSLMVQNSTVLLEELKQGGLDMAIIVEQPQRLPDYAERFLGDEKFALVCRKSEAEHYASEVKSGTLHSFLAYNQGSTTYTMLEGQLQQNRITIEPSLYSTNPSVLAGLAQQGKGITALPLAFAGQHIGGKLAEIDLRKPLYRPIYAFWHKDRKLPGSIEDFLDATEIQVV